MQQVAVCAWHVSLSVLSVHFWGTVQRMGVDAGEDRDQLYFCSNYYASQVGKGESTF